MPIVPGVNPCKVNQPLPKHQSFAGDLVARSFWRLSYRCGRNYMTGRDALGRPVVIKHEREKDDAFARRQQTKPRNHCGPIIRRYNDFVFRQKATRQPAPEGSLYHQLLTDIDGNGTPIDVFMRRGLKSSQVQREVYLLPDSTAPTEGKLTKAQAKALGVRQIVRQLSPDSVVWWRDRDGILAEAIVLLVDEQGETFARYYDAKATTDLRLKVETTGDTKALKVTRIEPPKAHAYGACPLVRLRPMFDDEEDEDDDCSPGEAQIAPLAELQQAVANYLSLLDTEIFDSTFTQWIASGVSAKEIKDVTVGSNRIICLPNPLAKFDAMGADPAQAESIAKRIDETQTELYRLAGVSTGDPLAGPGAPESGVAKAFRFNDLAANLAALADACEEAENALMHRLFAAAGEEYPGDAKYPDDFDMPDLAAELEGVIRVVTAPALPQVIANKIVTRFADRCLSLDEDEEAELAQQMKDGPPESADPFNPTNRRKTGT